MNTFTKRLNELEKKQRIMKRSINPRDSQELVELQIAEWAKKVKND